MESRKALAQGGTADATGPARVRTPGKHIVLFSLAVTFMLGLSTTMLKSGVVSLPNYDFSPPELDENGAYLSSPEEFIVDLSPAADGRSAMAKIVLRIAAKGEGDLKLIEQRRSVVRERIGFFLRELSPEDLAGAEARTRLKTELVKRVNLAFDEAAAADVAIETLVIQ